MTITLTKSPVWASYPLQYIQVTVCQPDALQCLLLGLWQWSARTEHSTSVPQKSEVCANAVQSFNWKPVEEVVRTSRCRVSAGMALPNASTWSITCCHAECASALLQDGAYEANPTCNWYYQGGKKVPDSQGFCCMCDAQTVFDSTFGDSAQRT